MIQNSNFGKREIFLFPNQILTLYLILFLLISSLSLTAQSIWKGGTPGQEQDWNVAKNWSTHKVPTAFDSVIIPSVESTGNFFPLSIPKSKRLLNY